MSEVYPTVRVYSDSSRLSEIQTRYSTPIIAILCLFFLKYSCSYVAPIMNADTKTAEAEPIFPVASIKQPKDSPPWTFVGYSDDKSAKEIINGKSIDSSDCMTSKDEISTIDFDDY